MLTKALWVVKLGSCNSSLGRTSPVALEVAPEALIFRHSGQLRGGHVLPAAAPRAHNLTARTGYASCSGWTGERELYQRRNHRPLLVPWGPRAANLPML